MKSNYLPSWETKIFHHLPKIGIYYLVENIHGVFDDV